VSPDPQRVDTVRDVSCNGGVMPHDYGELAQRIDTLVERREHALESQQ
jgi:hypothetical protein